MKYDFEKHFILSGSPIKKALERLDKLALDAIVFIVDEENRLIGSLTDGDIRRGLINGKTLYDTVDDFIQPNPRFIVNTFFNIKDLIRFRKSSLKIIPVLDETQRIVNVINFRHYSSFLPVDALIMAGGVGKRLQPYTLSIPKPLLKVGEKPIIEHNVDRLLKYGVSDIWISIKYLGEQIQNYFGDGTDKGIGIQYVWENEPLGTIGAIRNVQSFKSDYIIVQNSDLLTNIDYEDFFINFVESGADLSIASIPYQVNIPYAVLETNGNEVKSLKEKPTYTYYSNGGIYLMKKEVIDLIPQNTFFNATDLIEKLIGLGKKVNTYHLCGYWLDIGKHEDYAKAQEDIKHIIL